MITNLKVLEYLDIISPVNSQTVEEIRSVAKENYIPIIKRDTENLLKFVLKMQNPKSILEIGCAVGYSAIIMLENSDADIVTVEKKLKKILSMLIWKTEQKSLRAMPGKYWKGL